MVSRATTLEPLPLSLTKIGGISVAKGTCNFNLLTCSTAVIMCLAATASADPAQATSNQPASQNNSDALEEIVVTAQKRSENLTKVPVSISVLSGATLNSTAISNLDDLSRAVPGLSIQASGQEGDAELQIRGVSSTAGDSTINIYLNDTPISISARYGGATQPIPFDLARVEVLRGPQGTLYGASSLGGTIRYIQNKPDLEEFGGFVASDLSGTVHGGVNYETSALVNIPIIDDVFAIRVGGLDGGDSGWIDNYNGNGDIAHSGVNSDLRKLFRFSALYQPTDDLTIQANTTYQGFYTKDSSSFYTAAGAANSTGSGMAPYLVTTGLFKQSKLVQEWSHDNVVVSDIEVNANLGFADLTSISSFFRRSNPQVIDGTYYNSGALADFFLPSQFAPQASVAFSPSPVNQQTSWRNWSQEIRLSSPADAQSPWKWVGGIYVSAVRASTSQVDPDPTIGSNFLAAYGVPIGSISQQLGGAPNDPALFNPIYADWEHETTDQYAAFGQITYDILDDLHLSGGLRYSFSHDINRDSNDLNSFYDIGLPGQVKDTIRAYSATPRFSLSYDIDSLTSIYTTETKGFRLGGPAGSLPTGPNNPCQPSYEALGLTGAPGAYSSDSLWSYEAGVKSTLADRSLSVNGAGYYIDWSRLQQGVDLPSCGYGFTANAGDAEIYGGEIELLYATKFVKGLKLGLTASYNHAEITKTTAPFAQVGETVEDVPEWTATISADYDTPLVNDWSGFAHVDYDFTGHSHGAFQTYLPNFENRAYGVANAQVGVDTDTLKIYLFVKILLNDHTIYQQPEVASVTEGYTVRPFTIGVSVKRDF
jgi:outer membrane receptor protein involved in Fe transport